MASRSPRKRTENTCIGDKLSTSPTFNYSNMPTSTGRNTRVSTPRNHSRKINSARSTPIKSSLSPRPTFREVSPDLKSPPSIIVDAFDLKSCLKSRTDIMSGDRHVSVSLCHDDEDFDVPTPRIRTPKRGRSNSLPPEILQSQLLQFNSQRESCKLPALDEENKLSIHESSSSNPDVSQLRTRRVSFILPEEPEEHHSSSEECSSPKPVTQNFLPVPVQFHVNRTKLPEASDVFQLAMALSDEEQNDSGRSSSDATDTDSEYLDRPVSPDRHKKNNGVSLTRKKLAKRNPLKSSIDIRRSSDSARPQWSKVSIIR